MKLNTLKYTKIAQMSSILGIIGIKVKVTAGVQTSHLPQYKLLGPITQLWCHLGTSY